MNIGSKGQSSIEFAVLTAFSMLVFILIITLFNSNLEDINREKFNSRADDIYQIVSSEIRYAYESPANYSRTFSIPSSVDGFLVDLKCEDVSSGQDLIIDISNVQRVYFLENRIDRCTSLGTGDNSIVKICSVPDVCSAILNPNE